MHADGSVTDSGSTLEREEPTPVKGSPHAGSRVGTRRPDLTTVASGGGNAVVRRDPTLEQGIRSRLPDFLSKGPGVPWATDLAEHAGAFFALQLTCVFSCTLRALSAARLSSSLLVPLRGSLFGFSSEPRGSSRSGGWRCISEPAGGRRGHWAVSASSSCFSSACLLRLLLPTRRLASRKFLASAGVG